MRLFTMAFSAALIAPAAALAQPESTFCKDMIQETAERLPPQNEEIGSAADMGLSEKQLGAVHAALDAARIVQGDDHGACMTMVNAAQTVLNRGEERMRRAESDENVTADEQTAVIDLTMWEYEPLYLSTWSASALMDRTVYNDEGEEVGEVEDILMTPGGKLTAIIVEGGGILDIGDRHVRVAWDELGFRDDGLGVTAPLSPENMTDYSLFDENSGPEIASDEVRMSSVINRTTRLADGQAFGYVDDLLITNGEVQATVVRPDTAYGTGPTPPTVTPYYSYDYGYSPGFDYYYLPYDREQLAKLDGFEAENLTGPTPDTEGGRDGG